MCYNGKKRELERREVRMVFNLELTDMQLIKEEFEVLIESFTKYLLVLQLILKNKMM